MNMKIFYNEKKQKSKQQENWDDDQDLDAQLGWKNWGDHCPPEPIGVCLISFLSFFNC